ncbi:MAG: hypothetical protein GY820_36940 [Gammaproteobacteria bacterium]|nr:hypothetical protein [Gammaproteobacteria bacterium]
MLQSIRDKTSGWIAYLIVFLISIPFALWGVNSYLGGGEVKPAATVNGEEISPRDLDTAYANYRRRLSDVFGGSIPEALADESILKGQVLTQLIEETALRGYAEQKNYQVGDYQLNEIIRAMDMFHSDGRFDATTYQRQVGSLGYSTAGYEYELRKNRAMAQLQSGIAATTFTIPGSAQHKASLNSQVRKIRILTRNLDADSYKVDAADIEKHFESNSAKYMTEEQVKIDYIEISLDAVKAAIDVDEEQIRTSYDQNLDAYSSDETRTARHILLTVPDDASDQDSKIIEDKILDIRAQIEAGANFSELAKLHSQDPVSAADGGNLGEIERGMMVQPFEAVLFDLNIGDLSSAVKTSFGWHLIKLDGISGGELLTFEEVRDDLADELKSEMAESQIYDLAENLANLAYEQPDSLDPAVDQLSMVMQTSGWFGRHKGEGIAAEAKIRSAAFSSEVLSQGLNSEAIELADSRVVFIHLNELKPAAPKQLEDVRSQIISELKKRQARDENLEQGKQALGGLNAGRTLDGIASEWQLEINDPGGIDRNSTKIDASLLKTVFSMSKPEGATVYQGYPHANGDYSLIELTAVESVDSESLSEQTKSLTSATATQEYQAVIKLLAAQADVVRTPQSELEANY